MQDKCKKYVQGLKELDAPWEEDVREFERRMYDHVTPAAEIRCPKDMEALVWQDVHEIISREGSQRSRAYLKQLLSTWHEGECCQSLADEPCTCLRFYIDLSKQINGRSLCNMHGVHRVQIRDCKT